MEVYYINIEEFKKSHSKSFLTQYCDKNIKIEKRFYEYSIGRYLVKEIAKKYYNLSDTEIITIENGKPIFKNSKLHFSISHSKNFVTVCFAKFPCAIDIEYIKNRNLDKLSKHFGCEFIDLEDFYKFWTRKEALYKLNTSAENIYCTKFENEYFLTIAYKGKLDRNIEIKQID